jgi:lipopolysaccharide heptosyltransferase I
MDPEGWDRLSPGITSTDPEKILIIKPSALGDVIHSLPFLDALRRRFREAAIHWIIARGLHPLLEGHPLIDRVWVIEKDRWKDLTQVRKTLREVIALWRDLGAEGFDLVIDLQGLLRSGLMARATRAPVIIGFEEAREGSRHFYTHRVRGGEAIHAVDRYLKLLAPLGIEPEEIRFPFPPALMVGAGGLGLPEIYGVIAPSAGKEANRWPASRFGELARRLPLPTVVVAGKKDAEIADEVAERSGGRARSLGGKTDLAELVAVVRGARFMVSNDTGPMHIAAAFRIPVVAVFGPANPVRTGPYGRIHRIVQQELPCSPCYRKTRCRTWQCMEEISVDRVYEELVTSGILQEGWEH